MRLALVGVGQAGGKIVDSLLAFEDRLGVDFVADALAINTAHGDLAGLERVPPHRRTLIGEARVKGHGVGADNDLGAAIASEDRGEILSAVDAAPTSAIDAFLVVGALGGGTGSGAMPVVARELRRIYAEPVYGLGVLPASNEGGIYSLNAARSFRTVVDEVDNLLLFDNDAWRTAGQTVGEGFADINREIAQRFGLLFSAGEVRPGRDVAESIVDASEIINTLASGGVSTVGYATAGVETAGLMERLRGETTAVPAGTDTSRITGLVRQATRGRLTLPCQVRSTERALVVVAGPRRNLSRKGIEHGRQWLESETGSIEVRGGDYPIDLGGVAAVVLLSGVSDIPRLRTLQQVAIDAQDAKAETDAAHDDHLGRLLDEGDELSKLF